MKPYKQIKIFNFIIRLFISSDDFLYKWHIDDHERKCLLFSIGNNFFQFDDELPIKLNVNYLHITKKYHRLVKNNGFILCLIKEIK